MRESELISLQHETSSCSAWRPLGGLAPGVKARHPGRVLMGVEEQIEVLHGSARCPFAQVIEDGSQQYLSIFGV